MNLHKVRFLCVSSVNVLIEKLTLFFFLFFSSFFFEDKASRAMGLRSTNGAVSKEWKFMEEDEDGDIFDDLVSGKTSTPRTGRSRVNSQRKGSYSGKHFSI